MGIWSEYRRKIGTTRPWDMLRKNADRASVDQSSSRLEICLNCKSFIHITKQCGECGCIMPLKVKLSEATCPLGKW
jgi:hypothetical protein